MENLPKTALINSETKLLEYQKSLLQWYDHNQRDLPWRRSPSLYKTVVSEFMLQQTRVSTVIPYFENWLKKFPDFPSLAHAPEEKVLKAWEGLGYYSRARNLHKLARIAESWDTPPQSLEEWKQLPGVGPYIAAAVISITFEKLAAVCDGNVVRVLSRIFAISENFKDGATAQNKIRPIAQSLISPNRAGDYNQAIMELGATVCHRSSPLCSVCPLLGVCHSGTSGDWVSYPSILPKPKKSAKINRYWIEQNNHILLYTSEGNRLGGIWELPHQIPFGDDLGEIEPSHLKTRKRTIGNTEYTEKIFEIQIDSPISIPLPIGYKWVKWSQINKFTISGPHRKWIEEIKSSKDLP